MLEVIRWACAILLGLLGIYVTGMNYNCIYLGLVRKKHHSLIPLIGGGACALALLVSPVTSIRHWIWLPLVLDLGCAYSAISLLYAVFVLKAFKCAA